MKIKITANAGAFVAKLIISSINVNSDFIWIYNTPSFYHPPYIKVSNSSLVLGPLIYNRNTLKFITNI